MSGVTRAPGSTPHKPASRRQSGAAACPTRRPEPSKQTPMRSSDSVKALNCTPIRAWGLRVQARRASRWIFLAPAGAPVCFKPLLQLERHPDVSVAACRSCGSAAGAKALQATVMVNAPLTEPSRHSLLSPARARDRSKVPAPAASSCTPACRPTAWRSPAGAEGDRRVQRRAVRRLTLLPIGGRHAATPMSRTDPRIHQLGPRRPKGFGAP